VASAVAALFPAAPVGRRRLLFGALAVAAGTAVSLARTAGTGPFQSIWEEDARDLLTDAYLKPAVYNVFHPYVGYFQVVPRLMGQLATLLPVKLAAATLSVQAALVTALLALAVYVASGAHLRHPLARLLVSAPVLFSPVAENRLAEVYNRPATVQFFVAYAMFWLALWVPATATGRVALVVAVALAAVSTFLVVAYLPLAALRLYVRRDRLSLVLFGALLGGGVLQVLGLALHLTSRPFGAPRYEPLWALWAYVVWAVPHSVLGFRTGYPLTDVVHARTVPLVLLAWLAVVAVALAAWRFARPAWPLALAAAAQSVGLCSMMVMANGAVTQRYLVPVQLLLLAALVALLSPGSPPGPRPGLAPLAVFAVAVLAVGAVNFRWADTYRAHSPRWTHQVDRATDQCRVGGRREVQVRSGPRPWYSLVTLPCHDLTRTFWCQAPYCVQVGVPPRSNKPRAAGTPAASTATSAR
jgi:hypothetical protein